MARSNPRACPLTSNPRHDMHGCTFANIYARAHTPIHDRRRKWPYDFSLGINQIKHSSLSFFVHCLWIVSSAFAFSWRSFFHQWGCPWLWPGPGNVSSNSKACDYSESGPLWGSDRIKGHWEGGWRSGSSSHSALSLGCGENKRKPGTQKCFRKRLLVAWGSWVKCDKSTVVSPRVPLCNTGCSNGSTQESLMKVKRNQNTIKLDGRVAVVMWEQAMPQTPTPCVSCPTPVFILQQHCYSVSQREKIWWIWRLCWLWTLLKCYSTGLGWISLGQRPMALGLDTCHGPTDFRVAPT